MLQRQAIVYDPLIRGRVDAAGVQALYRHVIARQRAGLVGQDDRRRAERFHRRQVADQRLAFRHALRRHGERQGHGGQQALRHVGHDDADGEQEVAPERQAHAVTDGEEDDAQPDGEQRHQPRQAHDLALQGRDGLARRLRQAGDAAEFRAHSRCIHDGARLSRHQRGAGKQQIARHQRRGVGVAFGVARFRQRFAGDVGEIGAHRERLDQPAIGRHVVTAFEDEDVARHQRFGIDQLDPAVSQRLDLARQQAAQRRQRALGAVGLPEREHAIDEDDADDGEAQLRHALPRILAFGEERQARREPQDDGEEMGEGLAGSAARSACRLSFSMRLGPNSRRRRDASREDRPAAELARLCTACSTVRLAIFIGWSSRR